MYVDYNMAVAPHVMFDGGWRNRYLSVGSYWSYHAYVEECCQREVVPLDLEIAISWPMTDLVQVDITARVSNGSCCQLRGDIDHSGAGPDIGDLTYMVTYMFQDGPPPACMAEANVNEADAEFPDISDLIDLVSFMFQGGEDLVPCP